MSQPIIFTEFRFLFAFLPLTVAAFLALRAHRHWVLIAASLLFYAASGLQHAAVLVLDVLWVFAVVSLPRFRESRVLLWAAVVPPLLALAYYKYLGFLIASIFGVGESVPAAFDLFDNVILPAGISFFTFELVSIAVDLHRGTVATTPRFRDFSLFITFFPHLVAGPILRFTNVAAALRDLTVFRMNADAVARGLGYLCIGLALKVLIADPLGHAVAPYRLAPTELSQVSAVFTLLAFGFQVYFDFYGYSLIAIGLAALFGFDFPTNFARPYSACSPREFWQRWHITLSTWIRDYLYVPLGGRDRARNVLIVMTLCGLWHGAGWNFVIWGLLHGLYIVLYRATRPAWDAFPVPVQQVATFALVSLAWTFFLFDASGAMQFLRSLAGFGGSTLDAPSASAWLLLGLAAAVCFGPAPEPLAENRLGNFLWTRSVALGLLAAVVLLYLDETEAFVYFRF